MEKSNLTTKEQVFAELEKIYDKYKNLDTVSRWLGYIDYFLDNYTYNKEYFEAAKKRGFGADRRNKEEIEGQLLKLLKENTGVCEQFSQAIAILSQIDYEKTKDLKEKNNRGVVFGCMVCSLHKDGKDITHEVNYRKNGDSIVILDLSSMIHAKNGDFKNLGCEEPALFGFVTLEQYMQNLQEYNMPLVPLNKARNTVVCYDNTPVLDVDYVIKGTLAYKPENKAIINASNYYDYITTPEIELEDKYYYSLKEITLPKLENKDEVTLVN